MITVKIFGGLGNQMFQYAFGKAIALHNNYQVEYIYDSNYDRELGLKYFNIKTEIKDTKWNYPLIYKLIAIINRLAKHKLIPINNQKYIYDSQLTFDSSLLKIHDGSFMEGYWQSEKYFEKIDTVIKEEFKIIYPASELNINILNQIKDTNSVSIHFRRGDYITDSKAQKTHGTCDNNYYYSAIKLIISKVSLPHFFIFSDDIEWVKTTFIFENSVTYIDFNKLAIEDFSLMKMCKHNIIANSTFSWWAAWLNNYEDKIVIAPSKWFNDPTRDFKDVIPYNWIKIIN